MSQWQDFNSSASQKTIELTSSANAYDGFISTTSPQRDIGALVFQLLVITISTIGTLANVSVIYVLCISKELKKHAVNVLFLNQLSLDLFSCVWLVITYSLKNTNAHLDGTYNCCSRVVLVYAAQERGNTRMYELKHLDGTAEYWLCSFVTSEGMVWVGLYGSKVNLVTIAADRYLKIVHSLWHKRNFHPWMMFPAVIVAWLIGCLYSFLTAFLTSLSANGECSWGVLWTSNIWKATYAIATFIIFFALVFVSLLFCYGNIIRTVRRQARIFAVRHANNPLAKAYNMQALRIQMNAVKTMIIVSASFVVCWLPCDIVLTGYVIDDGSSTAYEIYYVTLFIAILNVCMNPFIYAAKYNTVKSYFRRITYNYCQNKRGQPMVSIFQLQTTFKYRGSDANTT